MMRGVVNDEMGVCILSKVGTQLVSKGFFMVVIHGGDDRASRATWHLYGSCVGVLNAVFQYPDKIRGAT